MNLIKEIEKNNYSKFKTKNNAIRYQNIKEILKLEKGQELMGVYLHEIYSGLNNRDIKAFKEEFDFDIHPSLLEHLKKYNGFNLFSGSFVLYGFGRVFENGKYFLTRDIESPLPFHLADHNYGQTTVDNLIIGSFCETLIILNNLNGVISRKSQNGQILEQWDSLNSCIEDLYSKIFHHYYSNGLAKNPSVINNTVYNMPDDLFEK